jgi:hypothetical protein
MPLRVAVVIALLGCGSRTLRDAGERCVATSECAPGLVCDLGGSPPVCSETTTRPPDAPPGAPDAPPADAPPGAPDARPPDARPPDAAPDERPDADPDPLRVR